MGKGQGLPVGIHNTFPNTEAQFIGNGKHYLQEDQPDAIGKAIADWYLRISS